MPDLNLLDDAGFEEESAPAPKSQKAKQKQASGGGGGGKVLLVLLIVILLLGAAVYFLNQRGILKLWGKKQPVVTHVEEEPFPPMVQEQPPAPQTQQQPPVQDSLQLALLDTTGTQSMEAKPTESDSSLPSAGSEKLGTMQGEYTVQVIAFKERKRADEIRANLEEAGYPAFMERIQMKNGSWYRVCIGKYPTRADAQKAVRTFGSQLQASYIIDKVSKQ